MARREAIRAVCLARPRLEGSILRRRLEDIDSAIHGRHDDIKLAVVVEVVCERHGVGIFAQVNRIGAPILAVDDVHVPIKRGHNERLRGGPGYPIARAAAAKLCCQLHHEHRRHHLAEGAKWKVGLRQARCSLEHVHVARGGAHHHLDQAVTVGIAKCRSLGYKSTEVALPKLATMRVESRDVASRVRGNNVEAAIAVYIPNRDLPLDLAHLHGPPRLRVPVLSVQDVHEPNGRSYHHLHLAITVHVGDSGARVDVGAVLHNVGRQVEVRAPLEIARHRVWVLRHEVRIQRIHHDATADVVRWVHVLAELRLLCCTRVLVLVEEVGHRHNELLGAVAVDVSNHRRAQHVRVDIHILVPTRAVISAWEGRAMLVIVEHG
mmetsp:Transcript_4401/g.17664  ORF Transcript_4401/g.17664 Transcript_4401/m.17664 type:complete len:378 (+) Transcript_4401:572-1705(+)